MIEEKINLCINWFQALSDEKKLVVAKHLFEHALTSEWIDIYSEEEAQEAVNESIEDGQNPEGLLEKYRSAYFTTCGDRLIEE